MKNHISMMLVVVMAVSYLAISGQSALAGTITPGNGCDEFSGKAKKLCIKYCEKLECDEEIPWWRKFTIWTCNSIDFWFVKRTGSEPPCDVDPCAELVASGGECPCDYFQVPFECWMDEPNIFSQCASSACVSLPDSCQLTQQDTVTAFIMAEHIIVPPHDRAYSATVPVWVV